MEENNEKKPNTQTGKDLFFEICRFLLVGGTATLVDYAVFYLFRQWLLSPEFFADKAWDIFSLISATAIGFCVGLLVNWILSVRFVFRAVKDKAESSSKKSFFIFAVIGLIGLGITEIGIVLLVHIFSQIMLFGVSSLFGLPWKEWFAKAIMTCIVLGWNYTGRKLLIFK